MTLAGADARERRAALYGLRRAPETVTAAVGTDAELQIAVLAPAPRQSACINGTGELAAAADAREGVATAHEHGRGGRRSDGPGAELTGGIGAPAPCPPAGIQRAGVIHAG